ncbi:MFS transporter [Gammaproteobacteria bacterium]|nr:MFS transporter [Gammaproteobacteria bacterium]
MTRPKALQDFIWLACAIAALFYGYEYFLRVMPSVMISELMTKYHLNAGQVAAMSAVYYMSYTPMQLLVGVLLDLYSIKRIMALAAACCTAGAYLFTLDHITYLHIGRFLIGFGSAFAFVGVLKTATLTLKPKWLPFVSGITTTLGMLGAISGEFVLVKLLNKFGVFYTNNLVLLMGVILTYTLWMFIPNAQPNKSQTKGLFQKTLKQLGKVLKNKTVWMGGFMGLCLYLPTVVLADLWAIKYLTETYHCTIEKAALISSLIYVGWMVGAPLVGWFANKKMHRFLIVGSAGGFLVSMLILYTPIQNLPFLAILFFLIGLLSSVEILTFIISQRACDAKLSGTSISMTNMIIMLSGLAQPITGYLLTYLLAQRVPTELAYQYALAIIPISFACGLLLAIVYRHQQFKIK